MITLLKVVEAARRADEEAADLLYDTLVLLSLLDLTRERVAATLSGRRR